MNDGWIGRARGELLDHRGPGVGWGYREGLAWGVEPTALACLGLLASGDVGSAMADGATISAAAAWMASIQRDDGTVPATSDPAMPGWTTPYAILLWSHLSGYEAPRERARQWLLALEGRPVPVARGQRSLIGHDPTLIGWPWVEGTHSWLEPTALAVLALRRERLSDHPRVARGIRLILDRAIERGGWNYGNTAVFGRPLRPQPGPTGIALLALAGRADRAPAVSRALDYLHTVLPGLHAGVSLGWGVIGLRAHDACPPAARTWLADAHERCRGRADAVLERALILLAAGEETLRLLSSPIGP